MHRSTPPRPPRALVQGLLGVALLLLAGCSSTDDKLNADNVDKDYNPMGPASRAEDRIGKYLGDLSTSMNAWNGMTLNAATKEEQRKQNLLEVNIRERVNNRFPEILMELETGPDRNRVISAAAVGFSRDPAALSPLIAALDDTNEQVVSNALLGLGMFCSPETPLGKVGDLLRYSTDSTTRWSAADCALSLVAAGASTEGIIEPARAGLTDAEEPMVMAQCALLLAMAGDTDSIDALGDLLFDDAPIVSTSAARALAWLGNHHDEFEGSAARALFAAMEAGDRRLQERVRPELIKLSSMDFEYKVEEWEEWVARLP